MIVYYDGSKFEKKIIVDWMMMINDNENDKNDF